MKIYNKLSNEMSPKKRQKKLDIYASFSYIFNAGFSEDNVKKGACPKSPLIARLFVIFLLISCASFLSSAPAEKGKLVGFVYEKDGTTPIPGAVIKLKDTKTNKIYESTVSDSRGSFSVERLESGIYILGATTPLGDFNSVDVVAFDANEPATVSISLSTYEPQVQAALPEIYAEQAQEGEARVGRVITYFPESNTAEVFIEKGLLQTDDRLHAKGLRTNFYQDVDELVIDGTPVKRAYAGQTAIMKVSRLVQAGDGLYIACKKGAVPFFLTPCGLASIIAAGSIAARVVDEFKEEAPLSAYKVK
jgi:hypothetical protein